MMLHHDDALHPSYFSPSLVMDTTPSRPLHHHDTGRKRKADDPLDGDENKVRRRRNPWTVEQSNLLKAAVGAHGKTWSTIMQHFPVFADWGRSQMDLKDRWRAMVKNDNNLASLDIGGDSGNSLSASMQHSMGGGGDGGMNHYLHHGSPPDMSGNSIHMILTQPFINTGIPGLDDHELAMLVPKSDKKEKPHGGSTGRRKRCFWTEEQTELLRTAVATVGKSWAQIERDYPQFRAWGRTQVDIKDRWRNLMKAEKMAATNAARSHSHHESRIPAPSNMGMMIPMNHHYIHHPHEHIPMAMPHTFDLHGIPDSHFSTTSPRRHHINPMRSV